MDEKKWRSSNLVQTYWEAETDNSLRLEETELEASVNAAREAYKSKLIVGKRQWPWLEGDGKSFLCNDR